MKIVCVLTNKSINEQLSKIKKFQNLVYAVEIRADTFYPKDIQLINKLTKLIRKKFPKTKLIFTFRKFEEGGKIKISENKRKKIVKDIISHSIKFFDFIDVEFNSPIKDEIYKIIKKNKKIVIFSIHLLSNFKESTIYKKLNQISYYLKLKKIKKYIIKIVINLNDYSKYFKILKKIHQTCKSKNIRNYTFFTTGKTSLLSRCISVILNMPLTYVAVKKPVIKTQPDIVQLMTALEKFGVNISKKYLK